MVKQMMPQDQVFWYLKKIETKVLHEKIKFDVVVVGGGMAGLSAAQIFAQNGFDVALLEKNFCGSGASGKSSGFITPDSELDLTYFIENFGDKDAKKIWEFVTDGVQLIENNIKNFDIKCDYQIEDTLVVASSKKGLEEIKKEHENRTKFNYPSHLYDKSSIYKILNSDKYFGGVRYPNTFGINTFEYCQSMKKNLQNLNVKIFEESPVIEILPNGVKSSHGFVEAKYIVVCVDRFLPDLHKLNDKIYQAQTFLMFSEPLNPQEIKNIFPEKNLMVWDTDLIYQYYRVNGNRFMIGGSNLISIFWGKEQHNNKCMFNKLNKYTKKIFPKTKFNFEYFWPGLIGVTKDIRPIADVDKNNPNIFYISGAAGLPWAAALGKYSYECLIKNNNEFKKFFSSARKFPIGRLGQTFLGKRISFAISNFLTTYK